MQITNQYRQEKKRWLQNPKLFNRTKETQIDKECKVKKNMNIVCLTQIKKNINEKLYQNYYGSDFLY